MERFRSKVQAGVLAAILAGAAGNALPAKSGDRRAIDLFNQQFTAVTLHMDNAGVMALWADDGVTLLPGMDPVSGKENIARWLNGVTARMPGYRVVKQEDNFHDIEISGAWASEWGDTYQVVRPPGGKPVIESHGKILLVLHKLQDGTWKIKEEMWTPGPRAANR